MSLSTITTGRLGYIEEADAQRINELLPQLSSSIRPQAAARLNTVVNSESNRVYVARDDGVIVGVMILVVVEIFAGTKCWIEDVVVDERHRGRGIAKRLMKQAMSEAPFGAKIDLTSKPERTEAHGLYRSLDFEQRTTVVFRYTPGK